MMPLVFFSIPFGKTILFFCNLTFYCLTRQICNNSSFQSYQQVRTQQIHEMKKKEKEYIKLQVYLLLHLYLLCVYIVISQLGHADRTHCN